MVAILHTSNRLLKNAHLHKREARSCGKFYRKNDQTFYSGAAQGFILLRISGALSATGGDIFDQPYKSVLFQHTYIKPLWNHNAIIFCLSQAEA